MEKTGHIPVFFIIGRPRTGTTLVQSLFDAHPNVAMPWECQFVLNLYPKYGTLEHWNIGTLEQFYTDLLDQWQFSAWNTDHEKLHSDLLACTGNITYRQICQVVYLNYISFFRKEEIRLIGDKNHGYTIYTDRLKKIYPEGKFVYVLRDYRDNYESVSRVDFELHLVSLVVYKWKYFYKKALAASQKDPGSFFFLRYEDLAAEPQVYYRKLCDFLGIDFMPDVFDFYKMKDKATKTYPNEILQKHHQSLFNPINTSRIGRWEKTMSQRQVFIADQVAGKYAEMASYERRYKRFSIWIALQAAPGVCLARFIYFMTVIIDKFPYRLREKLLSKGPLLLAGIFSKLKSTKK